MGKLFFTLTILWLSANMYGQEISSSVFLVGNMADLDDVDVLYNSIKTNIQPNHSNTIIFTGDLNTQKGCKNARAIYLKKRLDGLSDLNDKVSGQLSIVTGDQDWDNSGRKGMQRLDELKDQLDKINLPDALVLPEGCPGPVVISESKQLVIIGLNSQWFLHPHKRPESPDTDCKILEEADFWEELEDTIEDYENKNILLVAHHPVYSNGQFAGNNLWKYHLIPFAGTLYFSYRKFVGTTKDFAHEKYRRYNKKMQKLLSGHHSLIYASGHEFYNYIIKEENNFYMNSSIAQTVKKGKAKQNNIHHKNQNGYYRIDYSDNGEVNATFYTFDKEKNNKETIKLMSSACCIPEDKAATNQAYKPCFDEDDSYKTAKQALRKKDSTVVAGTQYTANWFKTFWMGKQYRDEWAQSIKAGFIDLDTIKGGLVPYAKGGGKQTVSLKLRAPDGKRYSFRSVNKNTTMGLSEEMAQTIYREITQDLISSQHPYGVLVASRLMTAAAIPHPVPELFIMPDHPRLGPYREEFKGMLGTLEEKPSGKNKQEDAFLGADKVVGTNQMFHSLFKSHNNHIDKMAYAKARLFDMWVGDWDRHEDNWKWALIETGKHKQFIPIPKDRDHVFSSWTGLIPGMADRLVMNAEHFGYKFKNIVHLNHKARHLDRQLATGLTLEDWLQAAQELQAVMSNQVIAEAFSIRPEAIFELKGQVIIDKLQSRIQQLDYAATELYKLLAKEVDITGSNKREVIEVFRNKDGSVLVEMYVANQKQEKQEKIFSRLFLYKETKAINIFSLSGKDKITINGEAEASIKIRIIGGRKVDIVEDNSIVKTAFIKTIIYKGSAKDSIKTIGKNVVITKPAHGIRYNNKAYEPDALIITPGYRNSSGNGFGLALRVGEFLKGFNKPDYKHKYNLQLVYYPELGAYRLSGLYSYKYLIRKFDFKTSNDFSHQFDKVPFFYGTGNTAQRLEEPDEEQYYNINFVTNRFKVGLQRKYWHQSKFNINLLYEYNLVRKRKEDFSIFNEAAYQDITGLGKMHLLGIETGIKFDFRDNTSFTKNGSLLVINSKTYAYGPVQPKIFTNLEFAFSHYKTIKILRPNTFIIRTGMLNSFGDAPFYHKSPLGSNSYLRGHVRNRFLDAHALFLNLEMRVHLFTLQTILSPIHVGVYGFWDQGITWGEEKYSANEWRDAVGGGVYLAPLREQFNLSVYLSSSVDKGSFIDFRFGWILQ